MSKVKIYLGSVISTRRIKKLVLTGEETVTYSTVTGLSRFTLNLFTTVDYHIGYCSHYNYEYRNADGNMYHGSSNNSTQCFFFDNNHSSATTFKQFLAGQYANGTPVVVYYIPITPETAAVNEPLMKIGDYADEITKTGTGVDIPTVSGSNTLSVGTTVQPSEMSIESISQWV